MVAGGRGGNPGPTPPSRHGSNNMTSFHKYPSLKVQALPYSTVGCRLNLEYMETNINSHDPNHSTLDLRTKLHNDVNFKPASQKLLKTTYKVSQGHLVNSETRLAMIPVPPRLEVAPL